MCAFSFSKSPRIDVVKNDSMTGIHIINVPNGVHLTPVGKSRKPIYLTPGIGNHANLQISFAKLYGLCGIRRRLEVRMACQLIFTPLHLISRRGILAIDQSYSLLLSLTYGEHRCLCFVRNPCAYQRTGTDRDVLLYRSVMPTGDALNHTFTCMSLFPYHQPWCIISS